MATELVVAELTNSKNNDVLMKVAEMHSIFRQITVGCRLCWCCVDMCGASVVCVCVCVCVSCVVCVLNWLCV